MTINCERCDASEYQVRVFNAIHNGRMARFCERCAIIENATIIKSPQASRLKESETEGIYERMQRISGTAPARRPEKRDTFFRQDRLKELERDPSLEIPDKNLNLIDHFHWEIMKNRRRKGLTQKQFARSINESETAIQMIENGKLPNNAEPLINKIERALRIRLRKIPYHERFTTDGPREPVLLDDKGNRIDIIPEEEMVFIEEPVEEGEKGEDMESPLRENKALDLKKVDPNRVTIGDLQKLHKRRIEATKLEQVEEQKKIEERKSIILAMREKERLILEEKKKQEFLDRKRSEEERKKIIEENKKRLVALKKRESDYIDKFLGGAELIKKSEKDKKL